ncbi:MAG: hypothetical protein ACPGJS_06150 [Flammeovirgaceae bacterium]
MSNYLRYPSLLILLCFSAFSYSQQLAFPYDATKKNPFGLLNPEAPQQVKDFAPMIGECECISEVRNADRTWKKPAPMYWRFKYIMNGTAVQDETLKPDGIHSGSIRQYHVDSAKWYVHYYSAGSTATNPLPTWEGSKTTDGKIILYRDQKAPNGMAGKYRLTFYDISEEGFKWVGEWVTLDETSFIYPTWKIECKKLKRKGKRKG